MRSRRVARHSSARGLRSENSSRYINTDHKRSQISAHGGAANALAQNLNKNLRPVAKKQRPKTAGRRTNYGGQQEQMDPNQHHYMMQNQNEMYDQHDNMNPPHTQMPEDYY